MTRFSLTQRERNTEILCSQCKHLMNGECEYLIHTSLGKFRLARMSRSGGECQLFMPPYAYIDTRD